MIPHERVGSGCETSFSKDSVVCGRCALNGFNSITSRYGVSTEPSGSGSNNFLIF